MFVCGASHPSQFPNVANPVDQGSYQRAALAQLQVAYLPLNLYPIAISILRLLT